MTKNSSQVDVENPDLAKFPLFTNAKFQECIIKPGELLYIPPKVTQKKKKKIEMQHTNCIIMTN